MALKDCDNCGGGLIDTNPTYPRGNPVPSPPTKAPYAGPPHLSTTQNKSRLTITCVASGLVVMVVLATSQMACKPATSAPEVAVAPDVVGIRAKAESGEADAQYNLGKLFAKGLGVTEDYKQAAKWYQSAADQGHAGAQVALGQLYEAGQGVPHDDAEAAKCYRRAAEQGNAAGQYSLAVLNLMGQGVPQSTAEALKWYRQAADQGYELAQYNLGMRYYEGKGVVPDPVEAYKWLSLAAAKRIPDAVQARDDLKRKLSREQITEGQRRADAFVAKQPTPPPR